MSEGKVWVLVDGPQGNTFAVGPFDGFEAARDWQDDNEVDTYLGSRGAVAQVSKADAKRWIKEAKSS